MSATVKVKAQLSMNNACMNVVEVTFDDSYVTGGEPLTPAQMGLSVIHAVIPANNGGYAFEYDKAAKKLKAYYGNNAGSVDGPLVQVASLADLDAVTATLLVIGY